MQSKCKAMQSNFTRLVFVLILSNYLIINKAVVSFRYAVFIIGYCFSISNYYNTYIQTISEHSCLRLYSFSRNNAVICFSLQFHFMVA